MIADLYGDDDVLYKAYMWHFFFTISMWPINMDRWMKWNILHTKAVQNRIVDSETISTNDF